MKLLKLVLTTFLLIGIVYFLNKSQTFGSTTLPPLGSFLSPYVGYSQNAERASDLKDKAIRFPALEKSVKIIFDNNLVPHIYAESMEDALFVQGYTQAQFRLWQIDISTRAAAGRLSEIMGEKMINYDKLQRRKGLVIGAKKNIEIWQQDPNATQLLQKFVDGINTYIENLAPKDYPIEFKLLDYDPEPYSLLKVALYLKSMEQTLNSRDEDLESSNTLQWLGKKSYTELYPSHNPDESPIIPEEVVYDFEPIVNGLDSVADAEVLGMIPHIPFEKPYVGIGSNNWAVHPSKTSNGHPIVCNDPHLKLSLPSIWYEVHLNTPDINVYGVTLPGFPGIIIGFNEDVAWGMTNVGQDVADWYRINWVDETKRAYWLDDQKKSVVYQYERFKIKNSPDQYDTIKLTHWGPVVHENEAHPFIDLAYKWLPHNAPGNNQIRTFLNLAKAKNYAGYTEALRTFASPAQNVVFGSKEGDVAIRVTGKFPIRKNGQGEFVLDGSKTANDWKGFIPFEHTPSIKNPARGFVSSANQRSTSSNYPYPYIGGFADYRGRMINRILEESDQISIETMKSLQNNVYGLKAEEALPFLLENIQRTGSGEQQKVLDILQKWDYSYQANKLAPVYFEILYNEFYKLVWDEMYSQKENQVIKFPESWFTINLAKEKGDHPFFDLDSTKQVEHVTDIIQLAFNKLMVKTQSINVSSWGEHVKLNINHLANIKPFSETGLNVSGHREAINATNGPRSHGPSWRMIVELKEDVEAYGIFPGGQSGNPSSAYYKNNISDWAAGKYRSLKFLEQEAWSDSEVLFQIAIDNE